MDIFNEHIQYSRSEKARILYKNIFYIIFKYLQSFSTFRYSFEIVVSGVCKTWKFRKHGSDIAAVPNIHSVVKSLWDMRPKTSWRRTCWLIILTFSPILTPKYTLKLKGSNKNDALYLMQVIAATYL